MNLPHLILCNNDQNDEEEATENWQKKAAIALFRSGNKRFLSALSDSIANGIPCLARASLVTVSWMSNFLCSMEDESFRWMACSILVPQLIELLSYNRDVEERVIASYSLLNLAKNSGKICNYISSVTSKKNYSQEDVINYKLGIGNILSELFFFEIYFKLTCTKNSHLY